MMLQAFIQYNEFHNTDLVQHRIDVADFGNYGIHSITNFFNWVIAACSTSGACTRAIRTYPTPSDPKILPGTSTTPTCSITLNTNSLSSIENGYFAQTNIPPLDGVASQPRSANPCINT